MDIQAQLKSIRIAPRKVRVAVRPLKGMNALRARAHLMYLVKRSAHPMAKLLDSTIANARHNHGMVESNLYIKDVLVNEGSKLKRFRAKGFGSSSPIQKKTSHIYLVLSEKVPGLKAETKQTEMKTVDKEDKKENLDTKEKMTRRGSNEEKTKKTSGPTKRRFFQRKAI